MKLYENVINALFVSFRSKGRGVIRNAFAPRDGGHLLLSLPLASLHSAFHSPSLSLSLFFFVRVLSFFFARRSFLSSLSLSLFSFNFFFLCSLTPLYSGCTSFRLASQETLGKKTRRTMREGEDKAENGEMEGPGHRRRVINAVVPRCAALRSRLWIARQPRRTRPSIRFSN